ncbi:hypothetical protein B0H14DRAFT_3488594 [Mycena olivaceomarginata]|nr:hypothetical protein B0H14DRAFT_3488594 [Mycena olivaceomarginata]
MSSQILANHGQNARVGPPLVAPSPTLATNLPTHPCHRKNTGPPATWNPQRLFMWTKLALPSGNRHKERKRNTFRFLGVSFPSALTPLSTPPKLSTHIETDSRENKCKATHENSDPDSEDNTSHNKRLRSASVEPPPHSLHAVDPPSDVARPPVTTNKDKAIPATLHFSKTPTMTNQTGNNAGTNTNSFHAIQGVTQLPNGQQYTTPPEGGFPEIHMLESPLRNTSDHTRLAWAAVTGPKFFVRVYRTHHEANARETVGKLHYVIPRIVVAPALRISPPIERESLQERLAAPWHFLVSGLLEEVTKKLTDQVVWATPTIVFLAIPYDTPLPRYIMTLQNFSIFDEEEGLKYIRRLVTTKLKSIKEATDFLVKNAPGIAADVAAASLDTIVVKALEIALPGGKKDVVWNAARQLVYESNFGLGVARTGDLQFICGGCKSYDHPVGLCFLQRIPGWFGETPKSVTADDATLLKGDERADKNAGASGSKSTHKKPKSGGGNFNKKDKSSSRRR